MSLFVMLTALSRLTFSVTVLLGATAFAAGAQPDGQVQNTALEKPVKKPLPVLGLMVGAGIPDGATASATYRPFSWMRAEAGMSYNMISKGVRAGVSLIPFGSGPSASLEVGHYFEGNANGIARSISGSGYSDSAVLQRVGYDFANAHLGLDFGMRRVVFFVHGGMSYIRAEVHNLNEQVPGSGSSGGTTVTFNQDPTVRVVTPSAKLGFIFYIW
jgi:hypothetical protein